MLSRRDQPFPLEAVRDLIGLVRALYAATPRDEAVKRRRLATIGRRLTTTIELSASTEHGSVGHRAAWLHAEEATRELGGLVEITTMARPVIAAAQGAVMRGLRRSG